MSQWESMDPVESIRWKYTKYLLVGFFTSIKPKKQKQNKNINFTNFGTFEYKLKCKWNEINCCQVSRKNSSWQFFFNTASITCSPCTKKYLVIFLEFPFDKLNFYTEFCEIFITRWPCRLQHMWLVNSWKNIGFWALESAHW